MFSGRKKKNKIKVRTDAMAYLGGGGVGILFVEGKKNSV